MRSSSGRSVRSAVVSAEQIVGGEHQLVQVGVRVSPVHEPLTPVAGGELSLRDGGALKVENAGEPEPAERAGVEVDGGPDDAKLAKRRAAGHGIGVLEGHDRLDSHASPGCFLPRCGAR